jgi:hypothetical protein
VKLECILWPEVRRPHGSPNALLVGFDQMIVFTCNHRGDNRWVAGLLGRRIEQKSSRVRRAGGKTGFCAGAEASEAEGVENTLRPKPSNSWLLTKRVSVRVLFGEPDIFNFERSDLLVNSGVGARRWKSANTEGNRGS